MKTYFAVVHQDEDSAYGVHFPDVPGCFSASDDLESLVSSACEALALHLEDDTPPPARSLAELNVDPDVRAALSLGGFLLAVPLLQLTGRTQKANITMDAGLLAAVDKTAAARHLTRSAYLADLARRDILAL